MAQHRLAQLEQHIMQALLLHLLGGQLQQLRVPPEQLAGIAGGGRRLHLVPSEDPHLDPRFLQRLDGVGRFLLQPVKVQAKCLGQMSAEEGTGLA